MITRRKVCKRSSNCKLYQKMLTKICDIYAVQQDTQSVLMSKFIQHFLLARNISDLIGPSSGAFCRICICRLWYVVIRVLLDTSSRYKVVGRTQVKQSVHSDRPITSVEQLILLGNVQRIMAKCVENLSKSLTFTPL